MSARAWEAILDAWSDADRLIKAALPSGAGDGDARFEARLDKLRVDLSTRLLGQLLPRLQSILTEEARQQLGLPAAASDVASPGTKDEVLEVIVPLAIHLDERVLQGLPPRFGPSWTRLQEEVIQSDDGGAKFYENLDALVKSDAASPLVLQVYLFCLCEGFFGRCIDEPERIAVYKDRIASRLQVPVAAKVDGDAASSAPMTSPKILPAPAYYAIAVAAALVMIFVLRALAR